MIKKLTSKVQTFLKYYTSVNRKTGSICLKKKYPFWYIFTKWKIKCSLIEGFVSYLKALLIIKLKS